MKLSLVKHNDTLHPDSDHNAEQLKKIEQGEVVNCEIKKIRDPKTHRMYFAYIRMVYHNLPEKFDGRYPTSECFRKQIEMYAGHFETSISLKGNEMLTPKSIKYESLDETEFQALFNGVKLIVQKHIWPELKDEHIQQEILQFF